MSASPLLRFHHQFTNAPERFGLSDVLGQKAVLNEFLLKPGSANAMRLKVVLKSQDACSQYLGRPPRRSVASIASGRIASSVA